MSTRADREALGSRIAAGAAAQCSQPVKSVSLRWPAQENQSLVINLYLDDRRIEIRASAQDLGITIPEASDPIEDRTPFYWRPSPDPVERMIEIANSKPLNENPWLSSGSSDSLDW